MALLDLKDGGHLYYEDVGSGRPIVLLHGWGMRHDLFREQLGGLSARFRLIAPDLRGHGDSSHLDDGQNLQTLVDDMAELIDSLDLSRMILVGWSMGAMIAWALMLRKEAARVSGLVSIDMVPRLLNDGDWQFGLRNGRDASVFSASAARMRTDWPGFTRIFVPRIFARGQAPKRKALVDWIESMTERNHPESMARLWLSMAAHDFRKDLAKINAPALVVHGALSQLYSEEASEWVAGNIPQAKRVDFAHSGHAPHLEEPDAFNRQIEKFADDLEEQIRDRI